MSIVTHFAKRTVCLRRRLHARLGVKVLKGFQLLFVPRSGVNHVSVTAEPAISPRTIPSIGNYVQHAWCPPPPPPPSHMHDRAAYNSRLTPFEHNFHNDMREQERSKSRGLLHVSMVPPDIQSGPRGRWPPVPDIIRFRNQYSSGIMSIPR